MFIIPDESEETIVKEWPVTISVPQNGGKVAKHEITMDFVLLPQEEIDAQIEQSRDSDGNADVDILNKVLRKLDRIQDAQGNKLEHSADMQARVIRIPYVRAALISAYFQAASGKKAQRKN